MTELITINEDSLVAQTNTVLSIPLAYQIQSDQQLIHLWLHSEGRRSERTRKEYRRDIEIFQESVEFSLRELTLDSLLQYQESLDQLSPSTQSRRLASVKSLLSFGHKLGYLAFDVAKVVSTPPIENKLSERILSEEELFRILSLETNPRNLLLLKVFYVSGGRVSETVSLEWRNLQPRESGGQITFFGKGGKTRIVLIPHKLWQEMKFLQLRETKIKTQNKDEGYETAIYEIPKDIQDLPVFISQKKSQLSISQAWRIVRTAALRAGISKNVSPHWFRHAHASHALDAGAPIHLVSETLGHSSIQVTSRYSHARPNESSSMYLKIK